MAGVDRRAVVAALVVLAVGLFGEVGWALIYLGASLLITMVAVEYSISKGLGFGSLDFLWWGLIGWGIIAGFVASGDVLATKTTLASWSAAWIVWTIVAQSGPGGRRKVSIFLVFGAVVLGGSVVGGVLGYSGMITNPNILVAMVVSAVPLISSLFGYSWKTRSAMVLVLVPVVLTGSRAGVLASLGIAIALWPAGRRRRWVLGLGGAGALAVIAWRLISRPDSLAWHRWNIWGAILESIAERPLWGIGAGSVGHAMGSYRLEHATEVGRWGHIIGGAESMPLGLVVRLGLPALVLVAFVTIVWTFRCRRPGAESTAILAAMAAMALFHDFWSEPAVLWWWAAVLGVITLRNQEVLNKTSARPDLVRWSTSIAVGGLAAWSLVQPAWGQWLWWHQERSPQSVEAAVKAEPWLSEPLIWKVETLLAEEYWTWAQASEALVCSHRQVTIQPGSAPAWGLHGKVNARIVDEFAAWPATIERTRFALIRAAVLEPRLPWYPYDQALMERGIGNLESALTLAKRSVELEPAFVRGWLLLARLELDGGHFVASRQALEKVIVTRETGESKAGIAYHHDLLRCPEWQVQEIKRELE